MKDDIPTGRLKRGLAGGKTAARVGKKILTYYTKRPFLTAAGRLQAKEQATLEGAQALFQGLSLLKGTALKMAQQLSLEVNLLPEGACRELARAYHQVPPINRALVRQVVQTGLGRSLEETFAQFNTVAFAAASLGQVHRAVSMDGQSLAIKIQYPGIAKTIEGDVDLIRRLLGPLIPDKHLIPTIDEIAARLHEEVDYLQEAENLNFFFDSLQMDGINIPQVHPELTSCTVLTTTLMHGKPLDLWLAGSPPQQARDSVAQLLNELLTQSLYNLHTIHADPNPGNFIIGDDGTIGLVDFGCVKRFTPTVVEHYRQLTVAAAHQDSETHFQLMITLGLIPSELDQAIIVKVRELSDAMCRWYGRLYAEEWFDFRMHPQMMAEGWKIMRGYQHLRNYFLVNPDLIFLDRTRYGLLRIFEMLGARVGFRNIHEW